MIHACHFVHRLPPEYSGAATQALRLARALEATGVVRSRIVGYTRDPAACEPPPDLPAMAVPLRRGWGKLKQFQELHAALSAGPEGELLHVHGYHRQALLSAELSRTPVVLKTTLKGVDDLDSLRARGALDRYLAQRVARVVSLTPALAASRAATSSLARSIYSSVPAPGIRRHMSPTR